MKRVIGPRWSACCALPLRPQRKPTTRSPSSRRRRRYASASPTKRLLASSSRTPTIAGADYDIAKVIMTRLGVDKFEGVFVNFSSLLPGLLAKRFDIVAAGLSSARIAAPKCSSPSRTSR